MIKWAGFGKLLKQLFFTLLISCFILLGGSFVSATLSNIGDSLVMDSEGNTCSISSDLSISCSKSNRVLGRSWGNGFNSMNGIFWSFDGIGVFHNDDIGNSFQGIIKDGFNICSGDFSSLTVDSNISLFPDCIPGTVSVGNYSYNDLLVLLSSKTPLYWWNGSSYGGVSLGLVYADFYFSIMVDGYGSLSNLNGNYTGFNFGFSGLNYNSINWFNNYVVSFPFGFPNNGPSQGIIDNTLTGDYFYQECTYGEIISELELAGFNKYMCYGGIDNYNLYDSSLSYNPIPGSGLRLSQILANAMLQGAWSSPQDWYNFWDGLYSDRYNNNYNAMWESYPAVYHTWFDLYYQYGRNLNKNFDYVREYCAMTVDINVNPDTIYNGTYFVGVCDTINDKRIYGSNNVGSGKTAVGTNWNGVGDLSGVVVSNDPLKFIQDFFNLSKENVPTRYDFGLGFLPVYIITFMCALILFRFLRH